MSFSINSLLCIGIFLLLGACVSKPLQYSKKEVVLDLPEAWKVDSSLAQEREGWMKHLSSIDVQEQISIGLKENPNIQTLSASIKGQNFLVDIAQKNKHPQAEMQLDVNPVEVLNGSDSLETKSLDLQLVSTWEADVWGRLGSEKQVAVWRQQVAKESLHFAKLSVAGQIAQLWLDAIQLQHLIDLNRQETDSWRLSQQILQSDYEEGISTKAAVYLIQTELALAKVDYHQLIQERDNAVRKMLILQGRFPDVNGVNIPKKLPDIPQLKLTLTPQLIKNILSSVGSPTRLLSSSLSILQPLFSSSNVLLKTRVAETNSEQAYWEYIQSLLNASEEIMLGVNGHNNLLTQEKLLTLAREEASLTELSANEDYT